MKFGASFPPRTRTRFEDRVEYFVHELVDDTPALTQLRRHYTPDIELIARPKVDGNYVGQWELLMKDHYKDDRQTTVPLGTSDELKKGGFNALVARNLFDGFLRVMTKENKLAWLGTQMSDAAINTLAGRQYEQQQTSAAGRRLESVA